MENKLAEIRSSQYMSQGKLAELLKVSQKTISSWEIGRTSPKPSQMQHIEDIFNTPKEEIFFMAFNYKNELEVVAK
ncbi:helix-turn-helix transcriptional regulator [Enterococcus casseliflavus]|uniref:helix-turn-helix transcriptional regulator n=1 Tax=Enterococcus casseliflavus TaxID=37734 RepID=UPI00225341A1|nr:helix-turn-helix transcriptional regulator [Enterococcus casseliflavus]MCX4167837.1 helix-turn-helix transcriptional regulator [Enterococcus casseliflavus]